MAADRQRPMRARRGRRDELHARAVRQHRREQRPLAADALVADPRHLLGKPLQQRVVDLRRLVAGHLPALLDPHFARPIDQEFGDVVLREPGAERLEISVEERVDALGLGEAAVSAHPLAPSD